MVDEVLHHLVSTQLTTLHLWLTYSWSLSSSVFPCSFPQLCRACSHLEIYLASLLCLDSPLSWFFRANSYSSFTPQLKQLFSIMVFVRIPCHMLPLPIPLIAVTTFVITGLMPVHNSMKVKTKFHVCMSSLPLYLQNLVQCLAGEMHWISICKTNNIMT